MALVPYELSFDSRNRPVAPTNDTPILDRPAVQAIFYAILATIPFFRWRQLPGPFFMKLDWLLMALLLAVIAFPLIAAKTPPARLQGRIWIPLFLFLLANAISSLLSSYPGTALAGMVLLGQITIFLVVNQLLLNDRGVDSYLPWTLGVSIGANAALGVIGWMFNVDALTQGSGPGVRGTGGTISANNMALMSMFVLPLMVYMAIYGSTVPRRMLGAFLAALAIGGVVSSESRGGFVNLVIVCPLLAWQFRRHFHPRYLGAVIGVASAIVLVFVIMVPQEYFQRQATLGLLFDWLSGRGQQLAQDAALDRRAAYLQVAADAFWQHPLLGHGTDCFQAIWVDSEQTRWFDMARRPAHNTYVEVLVGTGLLGFAAFAALLLVIYRNYRWAERLLWRLGDDPAAHLAGAYKLSFVAVLLYFGVKSGLDHKLFILAVPLSEALRRYAMSRHRRIAPAGEPE